MPSAEYDLRFLEAGVSVLEKYLLAPDLYWPAGANPPGGEPPYPRLTLGALLLAKARVHAKSLSESQQSQLERTESEMQAVRSKWRAAWGNKCSDDFRARLILWRNFLEEFRSRPSANYDRYTYEVGRRVQMHLLQPDADGLTETELSLLAGLDRILKPLLSTGGIVWEEDLQKVFPRDPYWYLYGRLRS